MAVNPQTGEYDATEPTTAAPDPYRDQFQTIPQGSEGPGGITGRGPLVPDQETAAQRLARFQQDYWAPDREEVLAQMQQASSTGQPGTAPTPGAASGAGGGGRDAFGQAWMASGGRSVADLRNFVAQWNAQNPGAGVTLGGSKGDKVYGPGGQFWADAVISAGMGGLGASWQTDTGTSSGGAASGGGTFPTGLGALSGTLLAPWEHPFTPRDPNQIAQDPAYQFQLQQGSQGILRNKAASGTLLTGGTLKALTQYGQGLASTYNDKYYGRDLGEYNLARENFWANQDRPFSKLSSLAQLGLNAT